MTIEQGRQAQLLIDKICNILDQHPEYNQDDLEFLVEQELENVSDEVIRNIVWREIC